jgi:diaminopimelate decarboxylase
MTAWAAWQHLLPDTAEERAGEFWLGGCPVHALAERFGTPLYLYDELTIRSAARHARAAFAPLRARVSFAAKACSIGGVLTLFREEGLDLDVVSAGEIEAARRAGFRPDQMHLHGNCKSDAELEQALEGAIRTVVVDSLDEIRRLEILAARRHRSVPIMLRLTLPLEAGTHPHLHTSGARSKFGLLTGAREEASAAEELARAAHLSLVGLHTHLGSQIPDADLYRHAAEAVIAAGHAWRRRGFDQVHELSVGGGWAVAYTPNERSLDARSVAAAIGPAFRSEPSFQPAVEPGRSLVARAGLAVYRVGAVKGDAGRRVVAVDGGIGDNPRPALYGAQYHAFLPCAPSAEPIGRADVVGRYCESGDVLASAVPLPIVHRGDLIAVPVAGAYHLSMASAYNLVPLPPVILVGNGSATQLVRRGTLADLFLREDKQ